MGSAVLNHRRSTIAQAAEVLAPGPPDVPDLDAAPMPQGPDTTAEIGDLWSILSHRRRLIVATTSLFGAAALAYGLWTTPLYTASVQILIDPRDRQVVTNDLTPSAVAPDGGVTQVESQVKVIQSNAVLLRAVRATGLADDPEFVPPADGIVPTLKRIVLHAPARRDGRELDADALAALRRKLAVKRADKVFVVDVVVTTADPSKSARIADAIADAYLADGAEARVQAASRAAGELHARLDGLRTDLQAAERRLAAFKAENGLIASSGRLVNEQQLSDVNARLVAAQGRTAEAASRLRRVRDPRDPAADGATTQEALNSTVVERLRSQYAELSSKDADLRMHLGSRHPDLLAVQAQEADVERLIGAELGRIGRGATTDYRRALANEASLTATLAALQSKAVATAGSSGRMRELEQDVETRRTVYNDFLLRSRQITEQANVDPANARVIGSAIPPVDASWPPRLVIVLAALVGGLSVGAGLAMGREYWKPTLLSSRQVERLLGVPVLATMPALSGPPDGAAQLSAALVVDGLHCLARPLGRSRVASVMVTGAPSEGALRHDVLDLLAASEVRRGGRVLVVDADLGGPGADDAGLLDVLRGECRARDAATEDPRTGAWWIGLGRRVGGAGNPFGRDGGRRFLGDLAGSFDTVVIDGGSLPANLAAGPLTAAADQLLAVFCEGVTPQSYALDLLKAAAVVGRPLTASVLVGRRSAA